MSEESRPTHDVFVSYASQDKTWADAACAVLEHQRVRCWIAPRDITPGEEWGAAIISGINGCRIMVLIFSRHSNASGQVRREVERAISRGIPVLPVRIEDVRPDGAMEFALGNRHWLDAFEPPVEHRLELLARSVKALLDNDARPADGPRRPTSDRVALPEVPPEVVSRRPSLWAWAAMTVGVLTIGFLLAWLGGRTRPITPDGHGMIVQEHVAADHPEGKAAARHDPKTQNAPERKPEVVGSAEPRSGTRIEATAKTEELLGVITDVDAAGKTLTILMKDGTIIHIATNGDADVITKQGGSKLDAGNPSAYVAKQHAAGKKGAFARVRHVQGVASQVLVGVAFTKNPSN
jgi:hypothetical protein